jgi:hypothetical protein
MLILLGQILPRYVADAAAAFASHTSALLDRQLNRSTGQFIGLLRKTSQSLEDFTLSGRN